MLCFACVLICFIRFFFNAPPTTEIYTLSLHDALPICRQRQRDRTRRLRRSEPQPGPPRQRPLAARRRSDRNRDRKSTRLNSSHANISYAVFCLKKKKKKKKTTQHEQQQ